MVSVVRQTVNFFFFFALLFEIQNFIVLNHILQLFLDSSPMTSEVEDMGTVTETECIQESFLVFLISFVGAICFLPN